ncbi:MAG: SpoIIE family protein phosphatase, partial [Bacteroidia bacterium]|nr:SpoIIE family protein phosphatase [Bacteroidia bacterium]MDW8134031.1 SpoIIE family protein phosphatase [Bacteroidia bacterium]
ELAEVADKLAETVETLKDSYRAAERLQASFLPPLEKIVTGAALYYRPLQEVGGDFYTFTLNTFSKRALFAVGDCTGHGIPGAILSGILVSNLVTIFSSNPGFRPHTILSKILFTLRDIFSSENGTRSFAGGEAIVGIADFEANKVFIACAKRPIWVYSPVEGLKEFDGGKESINARTPLDYNFPHYELDLTEDYTLYLFTDGITDVLSPAGKRIGRKAFHDFLISHDIVQLPPEEQKQKIIDWLEKWRGTAPLNDDMTLMILPFKVLRLYGERTFSKLYPS